MTASRSHLATEVQRVTGNTVEVAYVDQGYTGPNAAEAAQGHGIRLEVMKHAMAKRGFVLLPRRWVVERSPLCSWSGESEKLRTVLASAANIGILVVRLPRERPKTCGPFFQRTARVRRNLDRVRVQ